MIWKLGVVGVVLGGAVIAVYPWKVRRIAKQHGVWIGLRR